MFERAWHNPLCMGMHVCIIAIPVLPAFHAVGDFKYVPFYPAYRRMIPNFFAMLKPIWTNRSVYRGRCSFCELSLVQKSEGYVNTWVLSAEPTKCLVKKVVLFQGAEVPVWYAMVFTWLQRDYNE